MLSSPVTRRSVTQTRPAEGSAEPLSSTFHRRLPRLLSGRATIDTGEAASCSLALAALAGLSLLVAACGGSSTRHVAQLGTTTTDRSSSAAASPRLHALARVPSFPRAADPRAPQQLVSPPVQAPRWPSVRTRPPTPQVQQYRSVMLIYARCLRAHGVSNMPDPDSRGHLDIGPGSGVDVNSPRFQAAYRACRSRLSP